MKSWSFFIPFQTSSMMPAHWRCYKMPSKQPEGSVCDSFWLLSFLTTSSCFLNDLLYCNPTGGWEKHKCCSATEHKSLLSSRRRSQANWCSAGLTTKASVMSLQEHRELSFQPIPVANPSLTSVNFTAGTKDTTENWTCRISTNTKNDSSTKAVYE